MNGIDHASIQQGKIVYTGLLQICKSQLIKGNLPHSERTKDDHRLLHYHEININSNKKRAFKLLTIKP